MNTKNNLLNNRTLLITGTSSGIGRLAALNYARQGATVILLARRKEPLNNLYDQIINEGLNTPIIVPFDLGCNKEEHFIELADKLSAEINYLDGVLLNAAVLGQKTPIEHYSWSTWQQVINININGQFLLIKSLIPLLDRAKQASLLLTSSGVGRVGRAYWGAYSVSKFATEGLMQILAQELHHSHQIRVNSFDPGATRTSMRAEAYPAENPETVKSPEALMKAYVFLMSNASQHINGHALTFDDPLLN